MHEQEPRRTNMPVQNQHEIVITPRLPVSGDIFRYNEVKSMLRHFRGQADPPPHAEIPTSAS